MEQSLAEGQSGFQGKKELTFENFVTGDSNYVAYSAAAEVSEFPGTRYNPLFIFCNVGQGKTHLLHAIGWEFLRRRPSGIVQLINGDEFSEEIAEVQDRRVLRDKYSASDLLLVDDFHLLTEQARLEMVRLFEILKSGGGQLVLTSLRAPEELDIDDRLRSRIEGGLVCKILSPDVATRIGILRKKADDSGVSIKDGVLEDIARKVTANVRKLEGAINRLVVLSKARDEMISSDFAASALRDIMPEYPSETAMTYEAPAEGGESEFSDFVSDVAKTMARISPEPSEEARLREAYAQKLYVWEMKGFVVERLKTALDKKMDVLAREFVTFTSDVQRLIELQNRFGALNVKRFPEEAALIEKLLFDPSAVEEVRRRIDNLETKLAAVSPDLVEDYTFERFVPARSNKEAYEAIRDIAESPQKGPSLVFIWGGEGVGKSHLLNALARELYEKRSKANVYLLHGDLFVENLKVERGRHARGRIRQRCLAADLLLVDDVQVVFENKYATDEFMTVLDQRTLDGQKVVLVSNKPPEETSRDPGFMRLLSEASVLNIESPTDGLKREIAKEYLSRKIEEFSETDIEETVHAVGDNLWSLMDKLDELVVEKRGKSLELGGATIVEDRSGYVAPTMERVAEEETAPSPEVEPEAGVAEDVGLEGTHAELREEVEAVVDRLEEAVEESAETVPEEPVVTKGEIAEAEAELLSPPPTGLELPGAEEATEDVWMPKPEAPPSIEEPVPDQLGESRAPEAVEEEAPEWETGRPAPALDEIFTPPSEALTEETEVAAPEAAEEIMEETEPAGDQMERLSAPAVESETETAMEVEEEPALESLEAEAEAVPLDVVEEVEAQVGGEIVETAPPPSEAETEAPVLEEELTPTAEEAQPSGELPEETPTPTVDSEHEAGVEIKEEPPPEPVEPATEPVSLETEEEVSAGVEEPVESIEDVARAPSEEAVEEAVEPSPAVEEVTEAPEEETESQPTAELREEEAAPSWESGREPPALEQIFAGPPESPPAVSAEEEAPSGTAEPAVELPEEVVAPPVETEPEPEVGEEVPPVEEETAAGEVVTEDMEPPAEPEPAPREGPLEPPGAGGPADGITLESTEVVVEEKMPKREEERKPYPDSSRDIGQIMDTKWEIEGERMIDSI